jgi:hypothetical protein
VVFGALVWANDDATKSRKAKEVFIIFSIKFKEDDENPIIPNGERLCD